MFVHLDKDGSVAKRAPAIAEMNHRGYLSITSGSDPALRLYFFAIKAALISILKLLVDSKLRFRVCCGALEHKATNFLTHVLRIWAAKLVVPISPLAKGAQSGHSQATVKHFPPSLQPARPVQKLYESNEMSFRPLVVCSPKHPSALKRFNRLW